MTDDLRRRLDAAAPEPPRLLDPDQVVRKAKARHRTRWSVATTAVLSLVVVTATVVLGGGLSAAPEIDAPVAGQPSPAPPMGEMYAPVSPLDSYTEDGVPRWYAERQPLPSCPGVELRDGEDLTPSHWACLEQDRDGAELVVLYYGADSVEHELYRRLPGDSTGLDVMTDSSLDPFGTGGWTWQRCPDAVSPADLGSCTTLTEMARL